MLATVGTCASNAYPKAIAKVTDRPVRQLGSATLAAAIEGDPSVKMPIRDIIRADVGLFLKSAVADGAAPIDTLMLGCTHYPLVADEIAAAFAYWREQTDTDGRKPYAQLVAPQLKQVNPAAWTAEALWRSLQGAKMMAVTKPSAGDLFYISVPNPAWKGVGLAADGTLSYEYKYGRAPGQVGREDTINVPLTTDRLPGATAGLVREDRDAAALDSGEDGKKTGDPAQPPTRSKPAYPGTCAGRLHVGFLHLGFVSYRLKQTPGPTVAHIAVAVGRETL